MKKIIIPFVSFGFALLAYQLCAYSLIGQFVFNILMTASFMSLWFNLAINTQNYMPLFLLLVGYVGSYFIPPLEYIDLSLAVVYLLIWSMAWYYYNRMIIGLFVLATIQNLEQELRGHGCIYTIDEKMFGVIALILFAIWGTWNFNLKHKLTTNDS